MPRVTSAVPRKRRHQRILKKAKGYFGGRSRLYIIAKNAVERAMLYNYRDRRNRRREFRSLWIARINAGARSNGTTYREFANALRTRHISLDRKSLAHLAHHEPRAFSAVVKAALNI